MNRGAISGRKRGNENKIKMLINLLLFKLRVSILGIHDFNPQMGKSRDFSTAKMAGRFWLLFITGKITELISRELRL